MSTKNLIKNEKKLTELGKRLNILIITYNLTATDLGKKLNLTGSHISGIKTGKTKEAGLKFWDGIRREFPDWEGFLRGLANEPPMQPYQQPEEHMLQPDLSGEKKPGSFGIPDISRHEVIKTIERPVDYMQKYIEVLEQNNALLKELTQLKSEHECLKHNIELHRLADDKEKRHFFKNIDKLSHIIIMPKNGDK